MNGYAGQLLTVDLSSENTETQLTTPYADRFLGGRGIGAKIYWDEVPLDCSALDPKNHLIFTTGPASGTTGFTGARWQVCGKSPLNDRFGYANAGGPWGAMLKRAGYDGLIVTGKADAPIYLMISEDGVSINSAKHLWGKNAVASRERLKQELGKSVSVLTIGPAAENGVVFSTMLTDNDSSASAGFGAVLGAKNLKAICLTCWGENRG